jgi:hypothetical protein
MAITLRPYVTNQPNRLGRSTEGIYDVAITAEDPVDSEYKSEKTGTITAYR